MKTVNMMSGRPPEMLFWLVTHLSNKQKEVLNACLKLSNESGLVLPNNHPTVYQRLADHLDRSPGYTNIGLNELVWLGLMSPQTVRKINPGSEKGYCRDSFQIVGHTCYEYWPTRQLLGANTIRGKSRIIYEKPWGDALSLIADGGRHEQE